MPTNGDGVMPFVQNSDLYYLTGIDQEDTCLVLTPAHPEKELREVLFIKRTDDNIRIWEGQKLTKDEARETTGIKSIFWEDEMDNVLQTILSSSKTVSIPLPQSPKHQSPVKSRNQRFADKVENEFPDKEIDDISPVVHQLRMVKSPEEIATLKKAIDITAGAFANVLKSIRPDMMEYELEAIMINHFISRGSRGFAFDPIIASAENACVLHYIANDRPCQDGDLVLMDFGAEYAGYNADITRTIPVNGRFSKRQKSVYSAVRETQKFAFGILRSGVDLKEYNSEIGSFMEGQLLDLGLLKKTDLESQDPEKPAYRRYFMHGTSHHLGLDVHDVGDPSAALQENMVLTVEPGIYIREEGIGIRLENNVVIQQNGILDLSSDIPIEIEEIEDLMN